MAATKIKVFNKGQKIIAINGKALLPGNSVEVAENVIKIPSIASLIRQGFLETNVTAKAPNTNGGSDAGSGNSGSETPNTDGK